jgi:hypothetical protein
VLDIIGGPQKYTRAGAARHGVRDGFAFVDFDMGHEFKADIAEIDGPPRHLGFWSYEVCGVFGGPFVYPADDEGTQRTEIRLGPQICTAR